SYFPAYELVIDVLRDYRFYDVDLAHPNYMATEYVLEKFTGAYLTGESRQLMEALRSLINARKHRPMHPGSTAHHEFLLAQLSNARMLQSTYPFVDLSAEIRYFEQSVNGG
ncbi:MAG TPA: GSCFA domain-containing protein, partial [Chitinophagaceae bacterium]